MLFGRKEKLSLVKGVNLLLSIFLYLQLNLCYYHCGKYIFGIVLSNIWLIFQDPLEMRTLRKIKTNDNFLFLCVHFKISIFCNASMINVGAQPLPFFAQNGRATYQCWMPPTTSPGITWSPQHSTIYFWSGCLMVRLGLRALARINFFLPCCPELAKYRIR